jgi:hypothetical protein
MTLHTERRTTLTAAACCCLLLLLQGPENLKLTVVLAEAT